MDSKGVYHCVIVLEQQDYPQVRQLITDRERIFLPQLLGVLDGVQPGRVVVNDAQQPTAAVVFGKTVQSSRWLGCPQVGDSHDSIDEIFVAELAAFVRREQRPDERLPVWVTTRDESWDRAVRTVYGQSLFCSPRTEFEFHADWYARAKKASVPPGGVVVRPITAAHLEMFLPLKRMNLSVWSTVADYLTGGPAFGAFLGEQWVGYCDSLFVGGGLAELNIGILQRDHRGAGIGTLLAQSYIDACLDLGLTPCWSCETANTASYRMAKGLGFEPLREYTAYSSVDPAEDFEPERLGKFD